MGLSFNLAVIIGLVAGFAFGCLLALAWYLLKRNLGDEKTPWADDNLTSLKVQHLSQRRKHQKLRFVEQVNLPKGQHRSGLDIVSLDFPHRMPLRNQLLVTPTPARSLRSVDTTSIYSTDSAPIDMHDMLLQTSSSPDRTECSSFHSTFSCKPAATVNLAQPSGAVRRLSLKDELAPSTCDKSDRRLSLWRGYPALDPFYSDKLSRNRIFHDRQRQSNSLLPLYNERALPEPPGVKHIIPLLYGRGLSS